MELYKKLRPSDWAEMAGQDTAIKTLQKALQKGKLPHTICLAGPSGTGKTTVGRILAAKLGCEVSERSLNFYEMDAATNRGIDDAKSIRERLQYKAVNGKNRVYLIDECHMLTPEAQNALLKTFEDTPPHVYFILATTELPKLKDTVRSRCLIVPFKALNKNDIRSLVTRAMKAEKIKLDEEVTTKLIDTAAGNGRQAMVLLEKLTHLDNEEEQLAALESPESSAQTIQLCKELLNPRKSWVSIAKVLKNLDEDPERVRWGVLGYMRAVLLGGGKMTSQAARIINCFAENYFDTKATGLAMSCFDALHLK